MSTDQTLRRAGRKAAVSEWRGRVVAGDDGAGGLGRLFSKSDGVEIVIESFAIKELCVGTFFDDSSLIQDEDAVCTLNRGESMSNDKRRPSLHQSFKRFLDQPL